MCYSLNFELFESLNKIIENVNKLLKHGTIHLKPLNQPELSLAEIALKDSSLY